MRPAAVIVLAAGQGTRMKSDLPKVLHPLGGRTLLGHALTAVTGLAPHNLCVVVRHERDQVSAEVQKIAPEAIIADQDEIPGTGRAVQCGLAVLDQTVSDLKGILLVTSGDVPLLTTEALEKLVSKHVSAGSVTTLLTAHLPEATGYGRIVRENDEVCAIVEEKDATAQQRQIKEANMGVYAFDIEFLREALAGLGTENSQGEIYLTDMVQVTRDAGLVPQAVPVTDIWEVAGCNDQAQLAELNAEFNRRNLLRWMQTGVRVADPATTWLEAEVTVGPNTVLLPGTQLLGATTVHSEAIIGPDTTLQDSEIGSRAVICRTHAVLAEVGEAAQVGPYVSLRPGATVAPHQKVASFTELTGSDTNYPSDDTK